MFGSTRRPGMRGHDSANLGSLSGTVFGDVTPTSSTHFAVVDGQCGASACVVASGGTNQAAHVIVEELQRTYPAPRYAVSTFATDSQLSAFIARIRGNHKSQAVVASSPSNPGTPRPTPSPYPSITPKAVAGVVGLAVLAYVLFHPGKGR